MKCRGQHTKDVYPAQRNEAYSTGQATNSEGLFYSIAPQDC